MSMLTLPQMLTPPAPPATYASTVVGLAWVFFALAAALSLTGLWLLWRGVFRDPDRKRRRCSKCWYVMEGVPGLRCPECGRLHKDERRLHRRRRHRWMAAGGVLVLVVAFATAWTPRVANRGLLGSVPTWSLVLAAWVYDTEDGAVLEEAARRAFLYNAWTSTDGESRSVWPWSWMLYRSTRAALLDGSSGSATVSRRAKERMRLAIDTLPEFVRFGRDTGPVYVAALDHPSWVVRGAVLERPHAIPRDDRVAAAMRRVLKSDIQAQFEVAAKWLCRHAPRDPSSNLVGRGLSAEIRGDLDIAAGLKRFPIPLAELCEYGPVGVEQFSEKLIEENDAATMAGVLERTHFGLSDAVLLNVLRTMSSHKSDAARRACAELCAARWPRSVDAHAALVGAARADRSLEVRLAAMRALSDSQASPDLLIPILLEGMSDPEPAIRYFCIWRLHQRMADSGSALYRLYEIASDEREDSCTREAARSAIEFISRDTGRKP